MISIESYRQAIRNNALLVRVVIALSLLATALSVSLVLLFPLKTIEYVMYEFSSSGQTFYRIDSAQKLINRKTALIRHAMREYVTDKESVNHLTEAHRFVRVANMSTIQVFETFKRRYQSSAKSFEDKKRKITIELDTPFANDWAQQVHIVDFSAVDSDQHGNTIKSYWQTTISYTFNKQKVRLEDLIHNPLGLEVISYSINKRNSINEL